jgi:hypothetical protein
MQVGVANGNQLAIAVLAISEALDSDTVEHIGSIDAVNKALQIDF